MLRKHIVSLNIIQIYWNERRTPFLSNRSYIINENSYSFCLLIEYMLLLLKTNIEFKNIAFQKRRMSSTHTHISLTKTNFPLRNKHALSETMNNLRKNRIFVSRRKGIISEHKKELPRQEECVFLDRPWTGAGLLVMSKLCFLLKLAPSGSRNDFVYNSTTIMHVMFVGSSKTIKKQKVSFWFKITILTTHP